MVPLLPCRAILHVQSDYALMDMLDQLYTKTSSNPQCGNGLNTVDGGRNANAVSFARVSGPVLLSCCGHCKTCCPAVFCSSQQ
jgi:hypothetical protein